VPGLARRHPHLFSQRLRPIDINATVFLEFSNVIVFTMEQALKHFGIVIPWMVEPDTGE
jgi:hypothetical protein